MQKFDYDVIIAGGGMAGLTLACLLGAKNIRVACIDAAAPGTGSDGRTTAISYGSRRLLEDAGIWEHLGQNICPIDDIEILDGSSPVLLRFLKVEMENKSFGWICDNSDLKRAVLTALKKLTSVDYKPATRIEDYEVDDPGASAMLGDGEKISAKLIVGADGRQSFTRAWMGVKVRSWSYKQSAIICSVAHENPHEKRAVEHFRPGGPFAILPMADDANGHHRSAIVLSEHYKNSSSSLMNLNDSDFEILLGTLFPPKYGAIQLSAPRAAYPLNFAHAAHYIAPRMALVADAAHAIHPVAGQGLNLGFRDVKELASLIIQAFMDGEDIGSTDLLETYQRRRRPDNTAFAAVTDALVRLFANDRPVLKILRRAGLKMVSRLPPAKRFFMRQAMGDQ